MGLGEILKKKNKPVELITEEQFLNNLYACRDATMAALMSLEQVPYKSNHIRKAIKALWKEIKMIEHDINLEERWQSA